jgi:phospholipid/cholesterol/gamma-HCH transport system substrate-binding protein
VTSRWLSLSKPAVAVVAVALTLGVSGCSLSLESVPMPSLVSGPSYEVRAEFRNALNLPQGAPVKLDGNVVGTVETIRAEDYVAHVTLKLRQGTPVPRGTRAEVRTTAPMGEAFVELTPPEKATSSATDAALLRDGDRLPLSATATAPDVTDLLVALSATVTGGPFADISTIIKQLNVALDGHTGDIHQLLARLNTLVSGLNNHTEDIDRVLDGMDRLGSRLAADAPTLSRAIDDLTPAITTLRGQRADLMKLLDRITRLSAVSRRVIGATKESLVRQVNEVGPVLQTLVANMDKMRPLMQGVLDFGRALDSASPGDFARFDLTALLAPGSLSNLPSVPGTPKPGPGTPTPTVPGLPGLPGTSGGTGGAGTLPGLGGLLGGGG